MTQSVPIVPPQRKGSTSGANGSLGGSSGVGATRSARRVSVSGEKNGALSGLSERGTPSFSPYPQSLPTAHLLKKDGSSDGSGKEGTGQSIGTGGQQIRKKSRRPSESAAVLCQHCGKNYKHQQCLVKHLWEHSPYWSSIPDTQPLSKHQRVQLLEGASILYRLSGSPGGANGGDGSGALLGVPSSSLPDGSLTASGFAGPPGISPSPFGTSISRSGAVDTKAGIILEDNDDDENVIESDDEDESNSPPISSSAMDEDDRRQDDEPELFGTMEQ